ncbi:hypothetical protein Ping_1435 [Psychromonas ingrahamii 37]|uniref:Lipoprotein n=1 Tax=Psychromonas ingrahamii (strain DSM 17664 / CCUG 51855 / 37) TaxID=357804 RepID=A1SUT7_PSYIN|nr:hypothetical protein [Psychromonas ingrahamii]ABM03252.1 hypothetical protein Ping_1435 [Psychromonas ingrahamii 37]
MKKNLLAVLVAGTFMVACNNSDSTSSTAIKAYDGPVQFAAVAYDCGDDTANNPIKGDSGVTGFDGSVSTNVPTLLNEPNLCRIVVTGTPTAIDTSNGKLMPDIEYVIPKGLLAKGKGITAGPFTTLIDAEMKANNKSATDAATSVVTALYGEILINNGVDPLEMARDMEGTINKLKAVNSPLVASIIATNNVTSDVLVYSKTNTVDLATIIKTSKAVAAQVITVNPNYPNVDGDATKVKVATFNVGISITEATNNGYISTVSEVTKDIPKAPVVTGATGSTGLTGGGN